MPLRVVHRYLDPTESLLEVLFGLIMALTLTAGARLLPQLDDINTTELAAGLIGCNVAWGIIDAAFYLLGSSFSRNQRVHFVRRLQAASSDAEALAAIREEFDLDDQPPLREGDKAAFYRLILTMLKQAKIRRARLRQGDFLGAMLVTLLVAVAAIPGAIPLLLFNDAFAALRVANGIQVCLLFVVGFGWARHSGANPLRAGTIIALLGVTLVLLAVALGG